MIIVVGGIKGGTGKTTIATNLAVLRSEAGKKVLLVDADEQESTTSWVEIRESLNIPTPWTSIKLSGSTLHHQILKMNADYDDVILDAGGRDTRSLRSGLAIADIFLAPFKPRSLDIWTVGLVRALIADMTLCNPKLKSYAFINYGDYLGEDNLNAYKILSQYPELTCLDIIIKQRKAFANASSDGKGVSEVSKVDPKALSEMKSLYAALFDGHLTVLKPDGYKSDI